jgi:hypothetical protein
MESLTKAARNTVNLKKDEFTLGGEHSGILLLKIIFAKSQIDTRVTINLLMGELYSGMGSMMATHNNKITEFNAEGKELMQKLQSRGKNAEDLDLTPQLLVTYMACGTNETPFYRYIESLENKSNDGDIDLTTKVVMNKAETKYEELQDKTSSTPIVPKVSRKRVMTSSAGTRLARVQFSHQQVDCHTSINLRFGKNDFQEEDTRVLAAECNLVLFEVDGVLGGLGKGFHETSEKLAVILSGAIICGCDKLWLTRKGTEWGTLAILSPPPLRAQGDPPTASPLFHSSGWVPP